MIEYYYLRLINAMSHFFVSYSRKDANFVEKIVDALTDDEFKPWIDWKNIPKGEEVQKEIYQAIEGVDIFLFFISPDACESKWCIKEIEHAAQNNKRILPITIQETRTEVIHPEVSKLNWICCREGQDNFDKAIKEIYETAHIDYDWVKYHTRLQVRALEWEHGNRRDEFFLRGMELARGQDILEVPSGSLQPFLTPLQETFIKASILAQQKRKKRLRRGILMGMLSILILPYLWLSARFYIDTSDYGSGLVVRAGDPGLKILPGFDFVAIDTDYSLSDIADTYKTEISNENIKGFWLPVGNWGNKLYPILRPSQSGLAYWRNGQHDRSLSILTKAVRDNDVAAVETLTYLSFFNPPELDEIIDGILPSLSGDQSMREAGLQALDYIRQVQPEIASLQAARLLYESDADPETQVWRIEAAGILGADPNESLDALLELLDSPQNDVVAYAANSIAMLVSGDEPIQPALMDKIVAQVETLPVASQEKIIDALTNLDLTTTQKRQLQLILLKKLSSSESSEQISAMQNLSALNLEDSRMFLPVIDHLRNDPDQNVRAALPNLLLKLSSHDAADSFNLLANIALNDPSEDVRYGALQVFHGWYAYNNDTVIDALENASRDSSDLVRLGSLVSMTDLELETSCCLDLVENTLASKLDDESPRVRMIAAQGLLLLSDQIQNHEVTSFAAQMFSEALVNPTGDSRAVMQGLVEKYTNPQAVIATAELLLPNMQNANSSEIYVYTSFFEQALERQPEATSVLTTRFSSLYQNEEISGDVDYFIWQVNKQYPAIRARSTMNVVKQLSSADENTKRNALHALSILGRLDDDTALKVIQAIGPYLRDDNLDLRAEAFKTLGDIGKYYPEMISKHLPALLKCAHSSTGNLLLSCSQSILNYAQAEDYQNGLISSDLYSILETPAPVEVRISMAKALVAISDSDVTLSEQEVTDLRNQIASEQDVFTRYWLTGVLVAYSNPDTGEKDEALSLLKQEAVNTSSTNREEIVSVLLVLGDNQPGLGEQIIKSMGTFITDSEYSVRALAIISIREVGLTNIDNARLAIEELQAGLTSRENNIRWEAVANGVDPLLAAYPELAPQVVYELEFAYQTAIKDETDYSSLSKIQDAQILAYEVVGKQNLDILLPMIISPNYYKRVVGRAATIRILKTNPEMLSDFQEKLAVVQDGCRPQACLSISITNEMSILLQNPRFMELVQTEFDGTTILDFSLSNLGIEPLGSKYDPIWNLSNN